MDKKFMGLLGFFFLLFGLFVSLIVFEDPLVRFTKARQELAPSGEKSLIFAWPLQVPADGSTDVVVSVFIRNEEGDELGGKKVSLTTTVGQFQQQEVVADKLGKAAFILRSSEAGVAEIKGMIDGATAITHTITVRFDPPSS